jgi:hypothetical protein
MTIFLYTSSTGGSRVREATTKVMNLLKAYVDSSSIQTIYMDLEVDAKKKALREHIWKDSGKKGKWPLVYVDAAFLGDLEELERLNELKQIPLALNVLQALYV